MAKRRLLTKKRQRWAQNRDTTLRGKPLRLAITAQDRYAKDLDKIIQAMAKQTRRELMRLFESDDAKQFYAQDASIASQARILLNKLQRDFAKQFGDRSKLVTRRMVKDVDKASKSTLHASLKELSGGLSLKTDILTGELKEILTATIAENVDLIKTIPSTYFHNVRGAVMRSITQPDSGGLSRLVERLDKQLTARARQERNKARNLALDQTRKTYNNLNKGRMEAVGLNKFEWVHSMGGQNPRPLHQKELNGKVFSFDDLPIIDEKTGERGIPGQAINCRCTMLPVIEFNQGK